MMVALSPNPPSQVRRGVETFIIYLQRIFSDLVLVTLGETRQLSPTLAKIERLLPRSLAIPIQSIGMGKAVQQMSKKSEVSLIFSNGMYGWYDPLGRISATKIHIYHGSSAAFAEACSSVLGKRAFLYNRYLYSHFEAMGAQEKNALVSVSDFAREMLLRYHGIKTEVIENCVDTELFRPTDREACKKRIGLPPDRFVCGFVGPPSTTKGFHVLEKLADSNPNFIFLVVSPHRTHLPVRDNMRVVWDIPFDMMPTIYSALDLLLVPSLYEACSFVPLEAMSCDVPVVVSSTGYFWKMNGWYSFGKAVGLTHDTEEYQDGIQQVLDGRDDLKPREYAERYLSYRMFRHRYRKLVTELLGT